MIRRPAKGIVGVIALREAASEFGEITNLLQAAMRRHYGLGANDWVCLHAIFADRVIVQRDGHLYEFPYTLGDDNTVTIGTATQVSVDYRSVALREAASTELSQIFDLVRRAVRDARPNHYVEVDSVFADRVVITVDGRYIAYPYTVTDQNTIALGSPSEVLLDYQPVNEPVGARVAEAASVFIEALAADASAPPRYLVRVIRAGTSINGVDYPAAVLREAVKLFDGVRVFVKSDDAHVRGDATAKDFRALVGKLTEPRFVEAAGGEIHAVLDVLESSSVSAQLREAVTRGMTDLFGLSIDAEGNAKKKGKFREATKLTKVSSVDLIIEPGAGGQVIRFVESVQAQEPNMKLRQAMLAALAVISAPRAAELAEAPDDDLLTAYREAVGAPPNSPAPAAVTVADVESRIRMVEARATARVAIAASNLPAIVQDRLVQRFAEAASFEAADVDAAIKGEREFLAKLREGSPQIGGLGVIEPGEDRADKVKAMFDDFFDPTKKATSFREAYIEVTGDRRVTGLFAECDKQRLREAGGTEFREAVSSTTFSNILGDSITRALIRDYGALEAYQDWRWLCDVVPVTDFRSQERTRMGGYGNLPAVAQNGPYDALTTPTDEKATYSVTKRGGTETISLEAIANDDVGALRRIPMSLAVAAGRTLYEFVYNFLATNPTIYDTVALFHATHANLGTAALSEASFAAARLAMKKQAEKDSAKRLGITLRHLAIPAELEETAFDLFVRDTNNDETFVQSRKPTVHVVDYWTDTNNWFATADNAQVPLLELGFFGGEEPALFVQDNPTQGSLFSNDQIKYKIRHIYSGAVRDFRGFYGAIVA